MTRNKDSYEKIKGAFTGDKQFFYPRLNMRIPSEAPRLPIDDKIELETLARLRTPKPPIIPFSNSRINDPEDQQNTKSPSMSHYHPPLGSPDYNTTTCSTNQENTVKKVTPRLVESGAPKSSSTKDRTYGGIFTTIESTKTLPPHLRPSLKNRKSTQIEVSKVEGKKELVAENQDPQQRLSSFSLPDSTGGPIPTIAMTDVSQTNREAPSSPLKPITLCTLISKNPPTISMARAVSDLRSSSSDLSYEPKSWVNLAGSSGLVVNRPRGANTYKIPTTPANIYGSPRVIRAAPATIKIDPVMEKTLYFKSWPGVKDRGTKSMPRTIVITGLPEDSSLAMISSICRNTGLIESINLMPLMRKAMVWFIEATDAQTLYDCSGNGIEFTHPRSDKKAIAFIEMKHELDVLASVVRTNVTERGHSRVVRLVGWEREDLERLGGIGIKDESYDILLERLARKCCLEGKIERLEGVAASVNGLGHNEATMIFGGIKEAYYALGQLTRKDFGACNVTFGRDPCEPVVIRRV